MTDQGSHFKNELLSELTAEGGVKHHFVTAYCPWANGSIERICREVLRASKALTSEWALSSKDWPNVVECVQSVINHAPLVRLGLRDPEVKGVYRTPLEAFTGHIPVRPLLRAMLLAEYPEAVAESELIARRALGTANLQQALESMHRDLEGLTSASRRRKSLAHDKRTGVQSQRLEIGDFVLVRRTRQADHKLQFCWQGPRRLKEALSSWTYKVEDMLTGKQVIVHARRLLRYRADMDGTIVSSKLLQASEALNTNYQIATALRGIR